MHHCHQISSVHTSRGRNKNLFAIHYECQYNRRIFASNRVVIYDHSRWSNLNVAITRKRRASAAVEESEWIWDQFLYHVVEPKIKIHVTFFASLSGVLDDLTSLPGGRARQQPQANINSRKIATFSVSRLPLFRDRIYDVFLFVLCSRLRHTYIHAITV